MTDSFGDTTTHRQSARVQITLPLAALHSLYQALVNPRTILVTDDRLLEVPEIIVTVFHQALHEQAIRRRGGL